MAKMYRVYSIIPRERQDDYWLNIGVAFPHEDGKGVFRHGIRTPFSG